MLLRTNRGDKLVSQFTIVAVSLLLIGVSLHSSSVNAAIMLRWLGAGRYPNNNKPLNAEGRLLGVTQARQQSLMDDVSQNLDENAAISYLSIPERVDETKEQFDDDNELSAENREEGDSAEDAMGQKAQASKSNKENTMDLLKKMRRICAKVIHGGHSAGTSTGIHRPDSAIGGAVHALIVGLCVNTPELIKN